MDIDTYMLCECGVLAIQLDIHGEAGVQDHLQALSV